MPDALLAINPVSQVDPSPALHAVLSSRTFEKTPALRTLLTFLWRHREAPVSEYAIATEALGRPGSFDARIDATVRVQIGRLRQRLERYYEDEGKGCLERLAIPLGSHQIQICAVDIPDPIAMAGPLLLLPALGARYRPKFAHIRNWVWAAVTILLIAVCLLQSRQIAALSSPSRKPEVSWLWRRFFSNGLATRIVLPTPVFFSFDISGKKNGHSVMFRDTEVNEFSAGAQSPLLRTFVEHAGKPSLADSYTVTSDTFASVQLARYLDERGIHASVNSAAEAPMEALDDENVIAVGTWGTLMPLKHYLDRMDFRLSAHETSVQLMNRAGGEPETIGSYSESGERTIFPGIIAFVPGLNGRSHLLILAGRHTATLVSVLTSTIGSQQLEKMWRAHGSPPFFEVIVNAEMRGRTMLRAWPVALHPYKAKA